jgi:polysaccharide pyruvyl transferase WcaK-like protein
MIANPRVTIYGWYGIPNVGDEAILGSIIADLRELMPKVHINVFSYGNPKHILKYQNVNEAIWVPPHNLLPKQKAQIRHVLSQTDLFILGGGGIFHTTSGRRPWLEKLALAKILGCKTMLYTVGIHPSSMSKARWRLVWRIYSQFADLITVRDPGSENLLIKAGVKRDIRVIPDPVFRFKPSPISTARQILQRTLGNYQEKIVSFGIGMPPYRFGPMDRLKYVEIMAKAGDYIVEHFGAHVLLIPYDMLPGRDRELCLEVLGMMHIRERGHVVLDEYPPSDILALDSQMNFAVCTRLHNHIFAIRNGTPFVSIVYDQKVLELLKMTGTMECGINLNDLTEDTLIKKINAVWTDQNVLRQKLRQVGANFCQEALEAPKLAANLLGYASVGFRHAKE